MAKLMATGRCWRGGVLAFVVAAAVALSGCASREHRFLAAIRAGQVEQVGAMLDEEPELARAEISRWGYSPLHGLPVGQAGEQLAHLLLAHGADPNALTRPSGLSPLDTVRDPAVLGRLLASDAVQRQTKHAALVRWQLRYTRRALALNRDPWQGEPSLPSTEEFSSLLNLLRASGAGRGEPIQRHRLPQLVDVGEAGRWLVDRLDDAWVLVYVAPTAGEATGVGSGQREVFVFDQELRLTGIGRSAVGPHEPRFFVRFRCHDERLPESLRGQWLTGLACSVSGRPKLVPRLGFTFWPWPALLREMDEETSKAGRHETLFVAAVDWLGDEHDLRDLPAPWWKLTGIEFQALRLAVRESR